MSGENYEKIAVNGSPVSKNRCDCFHLKTEAMNELTAKSERALMCVDLIIVSNWRFFSIARNFALARSTLTSLYNNFLFLFFSVLHIFVSHSLSVYYDAADLNSFDFFSFARLTASLCRRRRRVHKLFCMFMYEPMTMWRDVGINNE